MGNLLNELRALTEDIRIAIVGIGSIGKGMVLQAQRTPGIDCVAIVDIDLKKAIACAEWLERDYLVVESKAALDVAIQRGHLAVCIDGTLVAESEAVDVFVEATNDVEAGGRHALKALAHGQHVVMMNYEADLLFGPYLARCAEVQNRVYSCCDGDQPAVLKRLIEEMHFMGFDLVMAGNIKGYLDRYANPTSIIPEADKRDLDYRMCVSYTDGTKLGVEMAVLANSLGLRTDVPGMHGPRIASIYEVFQAFDFDALWDGEHAVVDYVLGARPKGGVFAIGHTDHPYQQHTLSWFPPEMGPGPYYLFYRPYHLGHFESMATIAEAALHGRAVLSPDAGHQTNVYAYAKRDLRRGETLDGPGGYLSYGLIENTSSNRDKPGLPICLAEDVILLRDIAQDDKILMSDVQIAPERFDFELFQKAQETVYAL